MAVVGLISHCGAAQDVRRLTSLARTIDVHERVNVAARVLAGVAAASGVRVRYLDEPTKVVGRALGVLAAQGMAESLDALPVGPPGGRDAVATRASSAALAAADAGCVVTHGGDGTNRAVVSGWPAAVLVPLPGGTNNAFARCVDPTAAGLAAGLFATNPDRFASSVRMAPSLSIAVDGHATEMAVVDVAMVAGEWVGARAIWDPARLIEAVVVNSDPSVPGLAGVAGMFAPSAGTRRAAVHLRFGRPGRTVLAPLGPGQLVPMCVRDCRVIEHGETIELRGPGTLAFDGEREVVLRNGEPARVRIAAGGVRVLDVAALLQSHAANEAALHTNSSQTTRGGP